MTSGSGRRSRGRALSGIIAAAFLIFFSIAGFVLTSPATAAPATTLATNVLIDAVTPQFSRDGETVAVKGRIRLVGTDPVGNLSIQLGTTFSRLSSRGELQAIRDDPSPGSTVQLSQARTVGKPLPGSLAAAGQTLAFTVAIKVSSLGLAAELGVYPLEVIVSGTVSGLPTVVGRAVTFLVNSPGTGGPTTAIAVVLPLTARPQLGPDGTFTGNDLAGLVAPTGRLGHLLAAVTPAAGAKAGPVTLAVDPAVIDSLRIMASRPYSVKIGNQTTTEPKSGDAASFLAGLKAFADAGGRVLTLPYADADVVALTRSGQLHEVKVALLQGRDLVGTVIGRPPDGGIVLPAGGFVDGTTANLLHRLGVTTIVTSGTNLPAADSLDYTPTAVTSIAVPSGTVAAVVTDDDLGTVVTGANKAPTATVALQAYFAETAMITAEQPGLARPQVIVLPRDWSISQTWQVSLLRGLTTPWSVTEPLATVLATPPVTRPGLVYPPAARSAELPGRALLAAAELRATVQPLNGVLCPVATDAGGGGTRPGSGTTGGATAGTAASGRIPCVSSAVTGMVNAVLASESAGFRGDPVAAADLRRRVDVELMGIVGSIHVVASPAVTLTSRTGRVPITIENDLKQTVSVRLAVSTPGSARLASPSIVEKVVQAGQKVQVEIEVRAEGAVTFPLEVALQTPDGHVLGGSASRRILVKSTVYGVIAVVITACALGVLLLAVIIRGVRRLRKLRRSRRHGGLVLDGPPTAGDTVGAGAGRTPETPNRRQT